LPPQKPEKKMAKQQTFADKAKAKKKEAGVTVKLIKTIKTEKGTYKFNERFVKIDDISKVADIK
jgi:predicted nucleotidyltransferase